MNSITEDIKWMKTNQCITYVGMALDVKPRWEITICILIWKWKLSIALSSSCIMMAESESKKCFGYTPDDENFVDKTYVECDV